MRIGIDLSVLQTPHRMRGIGAVAINFINNLSDIHKKQNQFVFYFNNDPDNDPLKLLILDQVNFQVRFIENGTSNNIISRKRDLLNVFSHPKLRRFKSLANYLSSYKELYFGQSKIKDFEGIDFFFQFDQNQPLPAKHLVKSILVLYDIIPYVMESDYLWSYRTARARSRNVKSSIKHLLLRIRYKKHQQLVTKKAFKLIAISEHTKNDFVKYIGVPESRISVCYLDVNATDKLPAKVNLHQYCMSSWGYLKKELDLNNKKYILFIGGADHRRKLVDLLAAFNNLRAMDVDLKLILAGDTMLGPEASEYEHIRDYFKNTSYLDDIYFLGFVTEEQKIWLYKNAVAFVYPSMYEGFGLPILEAMQFGTPVITYKNSSIEEIAKDAAIYANDFLEIKDAVLKIINDKKVADKYTKLGLKNVRAYSWAKTSSQIIKMIQK